MIFRIIATFLHIALLIFLGATLLNAWIPPTFFPALNLLSLAFPGLLVAYLLLCLLWIIRWRKRALFFLAFALVFWNPMKRWINFSGGHDEVPDLKIISFNIKGGKLQGYEQVYDYLQKQDADIVLGQEYGGEFNVPGYPYRNEPYMQVAMNSKYEIKAQKLIDGGDIGKAFYADVDVKGTTVRIVNVYLTPFSLDKSTVKPTDDLAQNKTKVLYVLKRLIPVFRIHQQEVSLISEVVQNSPYPVILAGDFNAVPNSYEYYQLKGSLKDAFMESGHGLSTSFHDYKIPIRIDYVFASESVQSLRYEVDRSVKLSDHFPVITEFKINK